MDDKIVFVPGRISLIGGISDLVSPYLSLNKNLIPGCAIAVAIDKGIYSSAYKNEKFIYDFGNIHYECDMEENLLKNSAENNDYFSYMCGTLLYMLKNYNISGLKLKIVKMDLPIKKGLASSAAICITIAQWANIIYNLNLSDNEIIKIAYEGEHLALSKCGRLDQSSIVNKNISQLTFLAESVVSKKITVKKDIYILLVDLKANKDTRKIMNCFNNALPFPKNEQDLLVHNVIGINNKRLVDISCKSIENGDIEKLGYAFNEFQFLMDQVSAICDELKAPVLHKVLNDKYIKSLTYGGKGTGSGGDGTAMLLCKNKNAASDINEYLKEKYDMESFLVHIKKIGV